MSLDTTCEDCIFIIFDLLGWEELLELRLVNKYLKVMIDKYLTNKYKKDNIIDSIKELCTKIIVSGNETKYLYKSKYHNNDGPALIDDTPYYNSQSYFNHGKAISVVPNVKVLPYYQDYIKNGVHSIIHNKQGHIVQMKILYDKYSISYCLFLNVSLHYFINDKNHNDNGAAEIIYYANGNLHSYSYKQNGWLHRVDGPAVEKFANDGERLIERKYYYNGMEHNDNGPSYIGWYLDGNKHTISYSREGKLHRVGKPAVFKFYLDGILAEICYYYEGELHNDDGPAVVKWHLNGKKKTVAYYTHGKLV